MKKVWWGMGVVPPDYNPGAFPGWFGDSIGFHFDDSGLFMGDQHRASNIYQDVKIQNGDVIVCTLIFNEHGHPTHFTLKRNNKTFCVQSIKQGFYFACVALGDPSNPSVRFFVFSHLFQKAHKVVYTLGVVFFNRFFFIFFNICFFCLVFII